MTCLRPSYGRRTCFKFQQRGCKRKRYESYCIYWYATFTLLFNNLFCHALNCAISFMCPTYFHSSLFWNGIFIINQQCYFVATGDCLECAVCLQPCVHPAQLPCGHIFCFLCVKGIANQSKRCAMCRQEIPRDFIEQPKLLKTPEASESFEDGYQWFYEGRNGKFVYMYSCSTKGIAPTWIEMGLILRVGSSDFQTYWTSHVTTEARVSLQSGFTQKFYLIIII